MTALNCGYFRSFASLGFMLDSVQPTLCNRNVNEAKLREADTAVHRDVTKVETEMSQARESKAPVEL